MTQLKTFEKIAKESLTIETKNGVQIVKGSELACLRLQHYYRFATNAGAYFSQHLNTWCFRIGRPNGNPYEQIFD